MREQRRVLILDHTAALGGGEIALLNLVNNFDTERYLPIVLLFSDGPLVERLKNSRIEVHVLPLSSKVVQLRKGSLGWKSFARVGTVLAAARYVRRLARAIRNLDVDLVHTNSLKSDIIGGLAARIARKPLVWHIRDRIEADYLPKRVVSVFRMLCRILPDQLIAISQATLTSAVPSRKIDLLPGKRPLVQVIHDGTYVGPVPARAPGSNGAHPSIGLVGRISRWKGQHVFLKAAARVRERFPNARFQIIGAALFEERDYELEIHELAASLNLTDVVDFVGFRTDVAAAIADLDVLVHASISGEPFGQVVIEAMAAGRAVVATRGGGVPEIVVDGETGRLVPMGNDGDMADAICRLLADVPAMQEMGRRARQRVERCFTIQQTANKVQAVYDQMLEPQSTAASLLPANSEEKDAAASAMA